MVQISKHNQMYLPFARTTYLWLLYYGTDKTRLGGGSDVVSVACFGVRVSVMSHLMFDHFTFSSVWVAEWPPFRK